MKAENFYKFKMYLQSCFMAQLKHCMATPFQHRKFALSETVSDQKWMVVKTITLLCYFFCFVFLVHASYVTK